MSPAQIEITDKDHQTQDGAPLTWGTKHLNGTVSQTPDAQAALAGQSDLMGAMCDAGEAVARRIGDCADSKREAALKARVVRWWAGLPVVAWGGTRGHRCRTLSSLVTGKLNALSQQIADKKPTGNADVDQALGIFWRIRWRQPSVR